MKHYSPEVDPLASAANINDMSIDFRRREMGTKKGHYDEDFANYNRGGSFSCL